MKHEETEELVKNYFKEQTINESDTIRLINKIKPVINHKCDAIKLKKEDSTENIIFTLGGIAAFIIGFLFLFPETVDFTDILIQFAGAALVVGVLLLGIYFALNALFSETIKNIRKNNLRGDLL